MSKSFSTARIYAALVEAPPRHRHTSRYFTTRIFGLSFWKA